MDRIERVVRSAPAGTRTRKPLSARKRFIQLMYGGIKKRSARPFRKKTISCSASRFPFIEVPIIGPFLAGDNIQGEAGFVNREYTGRMPVPHRAKAQMKKSLTERLGMRIMQASRFTYRYAGRIPAFSTPKTIGAESLMIARSWTTCT